MRKFGRNYILEIEGSDGNTYIIEMPITLDFAIKRNILASMNTGTFKIYNLDERRRNAIYKDRIDTAHFRQVRLRAGYGDNLSIIFFGNIKEANSYKDEGRTEFVTQIDAYDLSFATTNCQSSWTIQPPQPSTKLDVINKLVNDLQGYQVSKGAIGNFPGDYFRGRSVNGNTWEILQQETGLRCHIDNGRVYCLQDNEFIAGDIVTIDSDNGLLASPKKADQFITAEILFEPRITPAQLIEMNSRTQSIFKGQYKVAGIEHVGTISGAVGGKCKTIISMFLGQKQFELINGT